MGSAEPQQDELTVLVTGFGPFKEDFPLNPSWGIASRLPDYLPPLRPKSGGRDPAVTLPPVRLLVYPEPIRVSYETVRSLVPTLWGPDGPAQGRRIDLAVHIGMAGPRPVYSLERRGHRDAYAMKDVDGKFLHDEERRVREGKDWVWYGAPRELETDFDVDDVLPRWKKYSPDDVDVRISEDAGRYLCDFIYFSSLAHLWKAKEFRRVVFLHVPADMSDKALTTGREIALQLIRSIIESELVRRNRVA
ncbi:hypothetical protein VTK73DRAFT_9290 [Phialemonium thermophilum]|uniref:Pyroglutamyl-peptidase I n=1 Tax=Phialemonium thermophilum TaxID=223376 RepID=A0ABR3XLD4_9PEZI